MSFCNLGKFKKFLVVLRSDRNAIQVGTGGVSDSTDCVDLAPITMWSWVNVIGTGNESSRVRGIETSLLQRNTE